MKRSLYQLNFSFISVGVSTTLWWTNTNKFFAADKLLTGRLCQLWTRANTSLSREKLFLAKQREEISPWRLQCCSTNKTFEGSNKTMPDLNSRPKQPLRFLLNILFHLEESNFIVERLFCATIHLELRIMMMLIITMVTIMNSNLPGLFLHSSHNPQRLRPGSAHFHLSYRINQLQFWEHISWSVCNMIWGKL